MPRLFGGYCVSPLGDTMCLTWGILHALFGKTLHASCILTHKAINDGNCYLQYTASNLTANVLADSIGERVRIRPGNNGHLCSDRREVA